MFTIKNINKKGGFTLIELLIVIAIIGVLAATVVVSLGSQTDKAQQGSVKIGVSSIRNLATVAVVEGGVTKNGTKVPIDGDGVCKLIYDQVSGEKGGWTWTAGATCNANDADSASEICCSSKLTGGKQKWVLWGQSKTGAVYCADDSGFAGDVTLGTDDAAKESVEEGSTKNPVKCEE